MEVGQVGQVGFGHYTLLIDHERAHEASQWYQLAFGAEYLYENWSTAGVPEDIVMLTLCYMQIGPVGRRIFIAIRDSVRARVEHDHSNFLCTLSSENADALYERAIAAQAVDLGEKRRGDHVVYKIRDPYGFCWFISSMNMFPPGVVPAIPEVVPEI